MSFESSFVSNFVSNFVSVRFITADIKRLVAFYARVTGREPTWYTEDFAEIATGRCTLAIGSTRTMQLFGSAPPPPGGAIIEFHVEDVDQSYESLKAAPTDVVQAPTTMPWGNRSLLCRDPDGNFVNLFTPVTDAAKAKFAASGAR